MKPMVCNRDTRALLGTSLLTGSSLLTTQRAVPGGPEPHRDRMLDPRSRGHSGCVLWTLSLTHAE